MKTHGAFHPTLATNPNLEYLEDADFAVLETEKQEKQRKGKEAEQQNIAAARANIAQLRNIQIGFSVIMLGGYVRLTATGMNIFSPKTLDDAFEGGDWAILLGIGTAVCLILDSIYFWAVTRKDKCELEERITALEEAKNLVKTNDNELTAAESEKILTQTIKKTKNTLSSNHAKILELIEQDIFIQELLLRSHIDREALLKELKKKGEAADIFKILNDLSTHVSLKNYRYSHESFQKTERALEYLQAVKIPFRYTSLLLLLNHRGFEYPDISSYTGFKVSEDQTVYEWLIVGGAILFAINLYAFHLEFKKNDINTDLDIKTRKIKSAHHNALLSTILLSLKRKVGTTPFPESTNNTTPDDSTLLGIPLQSALWIKPAISLLCLGSLGRRAFTSWGLTNQDETPSEVFMVLAAVAAVFVCIDIAHISLSVKEEQWKLKNKKDSDRVLSNCNQYGNTIKFIDNSPLSDQELKLARELEKSEPNTPDKFKTEHRFLYEFKCASGNMLWLKFALRAMSLSWAIIELRAGESFTNSTVGKMSAPDFTVMIFAMVGFLLGVIAQSLNDKQEKILITDKNTYQYTNNTLLFFKDPVMKKAANPDANMDDKQCKVKI